MNVVSKIKILKMLCRYLSERDNVALFYNHLTSSMFSSEENITLAFECSGYFEQALENYNKTCDRNALATEISAIFKKLKTGMLFWNDSSFEKLLLVEREEDDFLETPLEVAEGAITCKCGSERVYSFSKQTKGGDESTTVFALCSACKSKWVL